MVQDFSKWRQNLQAFLSYCIRFAGKCPPITDPLYQWFIMQCKLIEKGQMPEERLKFLSQFNVDFLAIRAEDWSAKVEECVNYKRETGNEPPPGHALYEFFEQLKNDHSHGELTNARRRSLEKHFSFFSEKTYAHNWVNMADPIAFNYLENNRLPDAGAKESIWLHMQVTEHKNNRLSKFKIEYLEKIGLSIEKILMRLEWFERANETSDYFTKQKKAPASHSICGQWLQNVLDQHRKGLLDDVQINYLIKNNIELTTEIPLKWLNAIAQFNNRLNNGDGLPALKTPLFHQINSIMCRYEQGKLSESQIESLKKYDFDVINVKLHFDNILLTAEFKSKADYYIAYIKENNALPPSTHPVCKWYYRKRNAYEANTMPQILIDYIRKNGVDFPFTPPAESKSSSRIRWEANTLELINFIKHHSRLPLPREKQIYNRHSNLKSAYKRHKLNHDQLKFLKDNGVKFGENGLELINKTSELDKEFTKIANQLIVHFSIHGTPPGSTSKLGKFYLEMKDLIERGKLEDHKHRFLIEGKVFDEPTAIAKKPTPVKSLKSIESIDEKLKKELDFKWLRQANMFFAYYREYDKLPPENSCGHDFYLSTLNDYKNGALTSSQITFLNKNQFPFKDIFEKKDLVWLNYAKELIKFCNDHNTLPPSDTDIGQWYIMNNIAYNLGLLSDIQNDFLADGNLIFTEMSAAKIFYCQVDKFAYDYIMTQLLPEKGTPLHQWLLQTQLAINRGTLSVTHFMYLSSYNLPLEKILDDAEFYKYAVEVAKYIETTGRYPERGSDLRKWLEQQRKYDFVGLLNSNKLKYLYDHGVIFPDVEVQSSSLRMADQVIDDFAQFGCISKENKHLITWFQAEIKLFKKGEMPFKLYKYLASNGVHLTIDNIDADWKTHADHAIKLIKTNAQSFLADEDLSQWFKRQYQYHQDQILELDKVLYFLRHQINLNTIYDQEELQTPVEVKANATIQESALIEEKPKPAKDAPQLNNKSENVNTNDTQKRSGNIFTRMFSGRK